MEVRRGGLVRGVAWHKRVKRRQTGRTLVASACGSCDMDDGLPLCGRLEGVYMRDFRGGGKHVVCQRDVATERLWEGSTGVCSGVVKRTGLAAMRCSEAISLRPRGMVLIGSTTAIDTIRC